VGTLSQKSNKQTKQTKSTIKQNKKPGEKLYTFGFCYESLPKTPKE
jgi:hypothetical protein